ncbi:hypothetical protein OE88DRAFT_1107229 [Heliocybe sulcata]|uniref:Uncharacterized protein n=1 Tax=Heliocybe sulcata TaxID=5364 RepID=A0A5C3MK71_9AGAM|nr:hypothetical protein OE88DRAFT_1107229 [Heliocybe sulcata]
MKVRWSSTYMMLNRAYELRDHISKFIMELGCMAKDSVTAVKLYSLAPTQEEWKQVKLFQKILGDADRSQQCFSSETAPALHLGIPALEELHAAWINRQVKTGYERFNRSLQAGLDKIAEYYDKTGDNDAYVFSISTSTILSASCVASICFLSLGANEAYGPLPAALVKGIAMRG